MVRLRNNNFLEHAMPYTLEDENYLNNQRQQLGISSNSSHYNNSTQNRMPIKK